MGNWKIENKLCCCCCAAILVYCSVRDWTRFCYVIGFENTRIHPCTRYRIHCGFIFPLRRAELKISGYAVEFAGCVWTEAVSGKKKLRIQKYPHTCGRSFSLSNIYIYISILSLVIHNIAGLHSVVMVSCTT